jgi:beta-N-acetylhexosaminidase
MCSKHANNEAAISLGVNAFGGNPSGWVRWARLSSAVCIRAAITACWLLPRIFRALAIPTGQPEMEVSTVRKSLEQLRQVELVPYFSVTTPDLGNPWARVDGLMVSHNRYQGFQGNIRATTRPISFDSECTPAGDVPA